MTKNTSNKISSKTFEILKYETFVNHTIEDCGDDLDRLYFAFMQSENPSDFERTSVTYAYFSIKKLLQSVKDKVDRGAINSVNVDISFFAC